MESKIIQPDKKELRARELSLQKTIHGLMKQGDQDSENFWKYRDQLTEVQTKLYKPNQH